MSFGIGENVGPYRIVEQLGSSGMATVFKAYHMAPKSAEPLVGLAATHLLQDRLDVANGVLDRAIRLNPDLNSAHLLKTCVLNKQSERVLALREFRLGGGAQALVKLPPWIRPVLNRMECTQDRFT